MSLPSVWGATGAEFGEFVHCEKCGLESRLFPGKPDKPNKRSPDSAETNRIGPGIDRATLDARFVDVLAALQYLAAVNEVEKARLHELSLACRAAQADKKGWVEGLNPKGKTN